MARKSKARARDLIRSLKPALRLLLHNHLLPIFLVLCVLGMIVGAQTRPDPHATPYGELFGQMSVASYRESPSDTAAHFFVDLTAGGRVFSRYDVDARAFLPPPSERDYTRGITGTLYPPLVVRGHVAQGLWLDVPRHSGLSLLPDQFSELYRATMDYVKPVSLVTGALGTLSGYSVGYRLGSWNSTLRSHAVQKRVLATPGLGHQIALEAWRRVLLEPVVMTGEDDGERFSRMRSTQRVYANFFRIALNDSDGFIPREADRLARLGHTHESLAMLAFADAVQHAAHDAPLSSADFSAVERWASLLVRHGHWATDAIPGGREERAQYLGMLAWYGVAPPSPGADRVWVGPRLLVRDGDSEGFVADEIAASDVACPIAWRGLVDEQKTGTDAIASAWLSGHPEFTAIPVIARRVAVAFADAGRAVAARPSNAPGAPVAAQPPAPAAAPMPGPVVTPVVYSSGITVRALPARPESATTDTGRVVRIETAVPAVPAKTDSVADTLHVPAIHDSLGAGRH